MIKKKKIFLAAIVVIIGFSGCEKIPDTIIDPQGGSVIDFKVEYVSAPDTLVFSEEDSSVNVSAKVYSSAGIENVYLDLIDPAGEFLTRIKMLDDGSTAGDVKAGDSVYSATVFFSKSYPTGDYELRFKLKNYGDALQNFALKTLYYFNGRENVPPVLSDLQIPDTVNFGEEFKFTVKATDLNGQSDIKQVYYELFDPSGKKIVNKNGISKFPLSDIGDTQASGDEKAGDGIYTNKLTFPNGQPSGKWRFDFTAVDKSDSASATLSGFVVVK
jgi:hypothetical protein